MKIREVDHFLFALVVLLPLCMCRGGSVDENNDRTFLSIGSAPPGGSFFIVGGALADVLGNNGGKGQWIVTAEATKGSLENIRRLDHGELELSLANSGITYFAVNGTEGWERPYPMMSLMTLAPNAMVFVTPETAGIETIGDLVGERVVVGVAGAGWEFFLRPILNAHGVFYEDFTPLYNTQTGAVGMLADGSAQAAFLGGAVPTASIVQATSSQDIRFLLFDDEAQESLVANYPFYFPVSIPAGTYAGQDEEMSTVSSGSMHLIVHAQMDEELAYTITRTIYENRERVVERHAAGRFIRPDNVVRETGTPFHPGAIRYYREIGIWPDRVGNSGRAVSGLLSSSAGNGSDPLPTRSAAPGSRGQ